MSTIFKCNDLSFAYGSNEVLNKVTFEINDGEIVTILGASGCGKTTLFRLITGLEKNQHGTMCVAGKPIEQSRRQITYMMQEDLLLPWRTVWDNLMLVADWMDPKPLAKDFNDYAQSLLLEVGLEGCGGMYPKQMSGGMRQRVSLARALLQDRAILLLDEPFGALDVFTREQMYKLLLEVCQKRHKTILLVTHDFKDALFLSDNIYLLSQQFGIYDKITVPPNIHDNPMLWTKLEQNIKATMLEHSNFVVNESPTLINCG